MTTNHDLRAIKALFREANRDGYITEDPSEFVDTVRKSSDDNRRPFTIAEIRRVLAAADPEWRSLVLFGLYTGQRLADIAALTWEPGSQQKRDPPPDAKDRKANHGSDCEAAEATY